MWQRFSGKVVRAYFCFYYYLKVEFLRILSGDEALAYVLHDSLFPGIVLRIGGAKVGKHVRVHRWLTLHGSKGTFKNLTIGDDVFVGKNVLIDLSDKVTVGNRCGIGMNTIIITHSNFGDSSLAKTRPPTTAEVEIMDDCAIGWGCVINKGTKIMKETILLPGAVVGGILQGCSTYGGNPARRIPRVEWENTR